MEKSNSNKKTIIGIISIVAIIAIVVAIVLIINSRKDNNIDKLSNEIINPTDSINENDEPEIFPSEVEEI